MGARAMMDATRAFLTMVTRLNTGVYNRVAPAVVSQYLIESLHPVNC
jgi:hypothetical protein